MKSKHDIIWLEEVDSTNDEARRRISDIDNLSVVSAVRQTAGRGQRGNRWQSADGENLTFSIVLKFGADQLEPMAASGQFVISEVAALSVVDFLARHDIEAKIKWPNDIYVGDKKICGILIENALKGNFLSHSIVGIGLNVNQTVFDTSLPNPTSMALCHPEHFPRHPERSEGSLPPLLNRFMDIFKEYSNRYMNITGNRARLRELYLAKMWKIDVTARFYDFTDLPSGHIDGPVVPIYPGDENHGRVFSGIIRGLSDIGNLLVEDLSDGKVREFGFKEIGYIL
ncbi:MAG: biotin--[acetyl-CoA-carboxylase] ligase [Bacteroidales bacterium]|nr:biotin--[acetyl-CoA-carboxylase] ligase [Bacteroidales bacterium]